MPHSALQAPFLILVLPPALHVLRAPTPLHLALHRVSSALVATSALLAPPRGPVSIADAATTAQTALALQRLALTKCLQLADGVLYKSKALPSLWKQPAVSITASGTSHQETAC